jgi:hypothetical protein
MDLPLPRDYCRIVETNKHHIKYLEKTIREYPKRHFRVNDLDLPFNPNITRYLMVVLVERGLVETYSMSKRGRLYRKLDKPQEAKP